MEYTKEEEKLMYYTYMNHHLNVLSKALKINDLATVDSQKKKLEEIRQNLIELGYFK